MYYAEIKDGVVVNVVVADEAFATQNNLVPLQAMAGIGWKYSNGVFTAPPQPEQTQSE
jgi:hypothetical protein